MKQKSELLPIPYYPKDVEKRLMVLKEKSKGKEKMARLLIDVL